mmetsp:Transcript_14165/g.34944  ORF Transcript_14165/g.34944 Transcript_14165/m.34944 type:complete len:207 (-) Transcript_14165:1894-2514(-)
MNAHTQLRHRKKAICSSFQYLKKGVKLQKQLKSSRGRSLSAMLATRGKRVRACCGASTSTTTLASAHHCATHAADTYAHRQRGAGTADAAACRTKSAFLMTLACNLPVAVLPGTPGSARYAVAQYQESKPVLASTASLSKERHMACTPPNPATPLLKLLSPHELSVTTATHTVTQPYDQAWRPSRSALAAVGSGGRPQGPAMYQLS